MERFLEQLKTFHDALDPLRRKVLYGAAVGSLLLIGVVAWFAATDTYTTVMEGARRDRVQATVSQLEELGIPYRIVEGGTGLRVPEQHQGRAFQLSRDANIAPAGAEFPEAKGFMTPRDQEKRYQFLLQQDLARNLAMLQGVNRAWVELVAAGTSSFFEEPQPARAAVVLELEPSTTFDHEQVRGVVALMINSVAGLNRDHLSIVDDQGKVLFEGQQEEQGPLSGALQSRQRFLERSLEQKVSDHLLRRLGSVLDYSVTATVELSTHSTVVSERKVNPDEQVVVSSQVQEESSTEGKSGGIPGTASNLPERAGSTSTSGSKESFNETLNYNFSEVQETTEIGPGAVKRQSVSVQVNQEKLIEVVGAGEGAAEDEAAEEATSAVDPEWIAAQEEAIEASIRAAVSFDDERGDVLHVTVIPFSPLEMEAAPTGITLSEATPYARYAVAALAIVLLFTMVLRPLVARVTDVKTSEDVEREAEEAAAEEAAAQDPDADLAARLRELVDNYESVEAADLNRLVDREAEAATQVIRLWSREG